MKLTFLRVLPFTCLLAGPVYAQQNDSLRVTTLDTVVLSSTFFRAIATTPATFQNINPADYEGLNTGQEPSFLLSRLSPSVTVYSDAGNTQGYSYFRMRGIDQTRINMTLDGVPLNEPEDQGAYFSNHPDFFNSISGMQIQRGVGISQNGTASFGGSMQFYSPDLLDSGRTTFGLGYGSFNSYRAFAEHNSGLKGNKAYYVRASQVHSNGYKHHSANNSQSLMYSGQALWGKHRLKITGISGHQQNQMAWLGVRDSLIEIDPRANANAAQEDDRFLQNLVILNHAVHLSPVSKLSSTVYYNYLKGNYDFDLNNFLGLPSTSELYNYAFRSHFAGAFTNYQIRLKNLDLTAGLNANGYVRRHTGSEATLGQLYENQGFKREASAFVKGAYALGKFTLMGDLQYRLVDFDVTGSAEMDRMNWQFLNPKGGISYNLGNAGLLYYSIGRVGREPTRTDIFGGNDDPLRDSLGGIVKFITNPEQVLDQEFGYRTSHEKWSLSANLFWMQFQDEITLNGKFGPNGLALNSDFAESFRSGVEMTLSAEPIEGLLLTHASSCNYSRITDQGISFQPIFTPWLIVNQSVAYRIKSFTFGLDGRYQSASFIDFGNSVELDDYVLLDGRVTFQHRKWTVTALGNNLLGTRYFNQGYIDWDGSTKLFVQAPRNFYLAATFTF